MKIDADARLWNLYATASFPLKTACPYSLSDHILCDDGGVCLALWTTNEALTMPLVRKTVAQTFHENGFIDRMVDLDPLVSHLCNGWFTNENPLCDYPTGKRLLGRNVLVRFPYVSDDSKQWFDRSAGRIHRILATV